MELSKEMNLRMQNAAKDTAWMEKLRAAASWEDFDKLLGEKDIETTAELKEAFVARCQSGSGKLDDDELEKVSGGWDPILPCLKLYNFFLCCIANCPHFEILEEKCCCHKYNWLADF